MTRRLLLLVLSMTPALAQVEGRVVSAVNGTPVRKARVLLRSSAANYATDADSDGNFKIANVIPGEYAASASRARFDTATPSDMPRFVAKGQPITGLVLKLTPLGAISGHILDADGDPISSAAVEVWQYALVKGQKQLQSIQTVSSNDHGEYRLFDLLPGQYFVSGSKPVPSINPVTPLARTFFGNALDAAHATPVDLPAGGEVRSADIRMRAEVGYTIRGRVPAGTKGQITLQSRDAGIRAGVVLTSSTRDDQYQFSNLAPGVWVVRAYAAQANLQAIRLVEIVDRDVDGADLTFWPPLEITGVMKVAGSIPVALANQRVQFQGAGGSAYSSPVAADGTFALHSVFSDLYTLSTADVAYLVSMKLGDQDYPARQLDLRQGGAGALTIVVSGEYGQVEGTVTDDSGAPVVSATVVLIPEQDSPDLYQTMLTDVQGHFSFKKVVPAHYRAFAWRDPPKNAPPDSLGVAMDVQPSAKRTVELKAIATR